MGIPIEDGAGRGYTASVSSSNRLNVSAKSNPRNFYISRDDQRVFVATSSYNINASADYVFYMKNTSSTRFMFINSMQFGGVESQQFVVKKATGTWSGTPATPSNMNESSGLTAEATVYANAVVTAATEGDTIMYARNIATGTVYVDFNDVLILGPNNAFAVQANVGSGIIDYVCMFHYEPIGREN